MSEIKIKKKSIESLKNSIKELENLTLIYAITFIFFLFLSAYATLIVGDDVSAIIFLVFSSFFILFTMHFSSGKEILINRLEMRIENEQRKTISIKELKTLINKK